jgi:hypothetical protein
MEIDAIYAIVLAYNALEEQLLTAILVILLPTLALILCLSIIAP